MEGDLSHPIVPLLMFALSDIPLGASFIVVLLLIVSGLISGSEVAFFSLTADQIKECREGDDPTGKKVFKLLQTPQILLATILICNNFVNVAIVMISTFIAWQIADQLGLARDSFEIFVTLTFVVTALVVFIGEIVPKIYATKNSLVFAKKMITFWTVSIKIFKPFALLLTSMGNTMEKALANKNYNLEVSVNEIDQAVSLATDQSDDKAKEMLKGIVRFGSKTVKQIMVSRTDMNALDKTIDFHELMDHINKSTYSRLPVYIDTIDSLVGLLYIKDLLPYLDKKEHFEWQRIIRKDIYYVPESKKIDELLRDFQEKRVHMAIIVDEYGGTTGLVTLEDIIEEIVGEINDEFDGDLVQDYWSKDASFNLDGKTSLIDFERIGLLPADYFDKVKGESDSLGGLILELLQEMPSSGKVIDYEDIQFTIKAVDKKRIKTVHVKFKDEEHIKKLREEFEKQDQD
ncbi:gliding motility-associated protein GldE [Flammeovirga kamogawensis]|uniref:Gliding motility-associated protein GldE n=1 Tax=Flammeovirga kamogawensis TaxID=373891 RepID=A0ABX8GRQ5_9BACT|nr:gliding motility-associated protein GldE [Flammeovirga kamogawensis]MBB6461350.1 gliding motility-associated protein GldE [Flammeovirga kamogawensis]QWG06255.1 gliding motility-associated protein GldE [Flammeovirga kamogawensis]TRX68085.1 gliding motility-associated protein GldE [Flammeovirga kamogawensis]